MICVQINGKLSVAYACGLSVAYACGLIKIIDQTKIAFSSISIRSYDLETVVRLRLVLLKGFPKTPHTYKTTNAYIPQRECFYKSSELFIL